MKFNLQNFEENLIARKEGETIRYVSREKCVYDSSIEPGDTVTLHARQDLEEVMLIGNDFLVRVESVDCDVIQGRLVMSNGVHDNALVRFRDKYVIACSKGQGCDFF